MSNPTNTTMEQLRNYKALGHDEVVGLLGQVLGLSLVSVSATSDGLDLAADDDGVVVRWRATTSSMMDEHSFWLRIPEQLRPEPRFHFSSAEWETVTRALLAVGR